MQSEEPRGFEARGADEEREAAPAAVSSAAHEPAGTAAHEAAGTAAETAGAPQPGEASADEAGGRGLEALAAALRAGAPSVEELGLHAGAGGAVRAIGRLAAASDEPRERVAERLVELAARTGVALVPVLYTAEEWRRLAEVSGAGSLASDLADGPAGLAFGEVPRLAEASPKALRQLLLRALGEHRRLVARLRRTATVPHRLGLQAAAGAVGETLRILFAFEGKRYEASVEDQAFFAERIAPGTRLDPKAVALHLQLEGAAEQAGADLLLRGRADRKAFGWPTLSRRLEGFLDASYDRVRARLSTAAELRRGRRVATYAGAFALVVLVAGGLAIFLATRPLQPLTDTSFARHRGGIVGHYYKGVDLRTEVFRRTDKSLNLAFGDKAPDPRVGADDWSARWSGYLYFDKAGTQRICAWADDGVRVDFAGSVHLDDWEVGPPRMPCEIVRVLKGWYPIDIEFFEVKEYAHLKVLVGTDREHLHAPARSNLCCTE